MNQFLTVFLKEVSRPNYIHLPLNVGGTSLVQMTDCNKSQMHQIKHEQYTLMASFKAL